MNKPEKTNLANWIVILNVVVIAIANFLGRTYPIPVGIVVILYFAVMLGVSINKRKLLQTENLADASKINKEIWINVAWLALSLAILGFNIYSIGGFMPRKSNGEMSVETMVVISTNSAKNELNLPQKIDEVTTLVDIKPNGKKIQYFYQVEGVSIEHFSQVDIFKSVSSRLCSDSDTRFILDKGAGMEYTYTILESDENYNFTVWLSDCAE